MRNTGPKLVIGGFILLVLLLIGGCTVGDYLYSTRTVETITITVTDKERVADRDDDGARYMVWADIIDEDGNVTGSETFEVTDDWWQGQFRAADTYGEIRRGETYEVKVNGWRNGFFSSNRNIFRIVEEVDTSGES